MSARHNGHDLPLGPPRRRTLLALLLIRLGRVVPTELLIEELWGDAAPRHAVATLQSHVSHLRRALQTKTGTGQLSVLRHRTPGYVLDLDPEQVDACRFEHLVTGGRRLLEQRDPSTAQSRLTEALGLWRGSPYTEFDSHPPLSDERTRLEQIRLTAVEAYAEARLTLGAAEEVAADLDGEARRHPTRERLVGHLMTALSRLGRQAEALELYERTRSHLIEEFGVETAAELRRVRNAILRQEPGASAPSKELSPAPHESTGTSHVPLEGNEIGDDGVQNSEGFEGSWDGRAAVTPRGQGRAVATDDADGTDDSGPAVEREGTTGTGARPQARTDVPPGARAAAAGTQAATAQWRPVPGPEHEPAAASEAGASPESESGWTAAPSPFTGRSQELDRLTTAAASAVVGHGHVAGVLGPPGVGKTRLLLELAARLESMDAHEKGFGLEVVWSHCFPGEGVPAYWLWTQILRRLSATRPEAFREATEPYGALLAPLMPERSAARTGGPKWASDWSQARFLAHDAVCEVLLALAGKQALVLLLEDLQWADTASLDLLRLLSTRCQGHPLGIVLTAREFEAESDATLRRMVSDVLRGPRTETLRLRGLSPQAVGALVEAHAGPGVDPKVVEVLHRRSEGNPYFVMQLLSLVGDARKLHRPDAVDALLAHIPTGVREALHQRFAALSEPVLRVLRLCAVIGAEVDTDLLQRTATRDEPVVAGLESAIHAGLLEEDPHHPGRLHFAHALVQETLVAELPREDRHRLHARVADALCARRRGQVGNEEIERVAHHSWHAKSALSPAEVLPRLLLAAEHAEECMAYEQVEIWLRRAVHLVGFLPPDDSATVSLEQKLHIQLGQVLATTRGYGHPEAETALTRGRALSTATHAPEDPSVLWALCTAHLVTGRYDASRQFSGLLREISRQTREPVAALGAAYGEGIVLHVRGMLPQALAELERGVGMADRFADEGHALARTFQHDPRVSCRSYDTFTHWLLGHQQAADARRRELLSLTGYESRPSDRSFALYVDGVVAAWEGDARTALASSDEGVRVAGEHGLLYWKAMLGVVKGWGLAHAGEHDAGLALMYGSLAELGQSRTYLRHPLHLGLLGQAQHHTGRIEEARTTFRMLLAAVEQRRERVYLHPALPATPLLHELLGHGTDDELTGRGPGRDGPD
ncbi:BTAD domain-containing putative transcriptional regulator [Streptomyces sp. HUAS TT20]|uniref:BTAD domain-containing putative transcriptional regulator n=1 Tax=Streptomyces sp. HUAS TT20 TaxID=3447509 RepID=UPI0021DAEE00|nr:BTAD domain-containing putative transcriptional regulator [Streptomyces sp. HUAS 15-9]UXY25274.1 AAA family ATPase [Streptomyces sp. HUAS 15-9]